MNTQDQLDRLLVKIKKIAAAGAQRSWDLGALLLPIFNKELWTARKDKHGNKLYRCFDRFIRVEIGVRSSTARRAMHVAERFERADLKGVTDAIAYKAANVRDPAVRRKLVTSGGALFGVEQYVNALPAEALFSATHRVTHGNYWSLHAAELFLARYGGKVAIRASNGTFVVTYAMKSGVTRLAQSSRLNTAFNEVLTPPARVKTRRAA